MTNCQLFRYTVPSQKFPPTLIFHVSCFLIKIFDQNSIFYSIMIHTSLNIISGNHHCHSQYSPVQKELIKRAYNAGLTINKISKFYHVSQSFTHYVLNSLQHDLTETVRPCFDRSKIMSICSEHLVLHLVCLNLKIIYLELKQKTDLNILRSIMYQMFRKHDIINWISKKHSLLTSKAADKRYIWIKAHEHWVYNDWKKIIWSDEDSVKWDVESQH